MAIIGLIRILSFRGLRARRPSPCASRPLESNFLRTPWRKRWTNEWLPREEQAKIVASIVWSLPGHYYLLIGQKGTGKSSISLEEVNGVGISTFEAYSDLEIYRIRIGNALDVEFYEEYMFPRL